MTVTRPGGALVPAWLEAAGALLRRRPADSAALVAALAFLNTLPNQPVLDDGWAVLDNPLVRRLDLAQTFRAEYGAGGATVAGVYRPIATLTWALQYALHGLALPRSSGHRGYAAEARERQLNSVSLGLR